MFEAILHGTLHDFAVAGGIACVAGLEKAVGGLDMAVVGQGFPGIDHLQFVATLQNGSSQWVSRGWAALLAGR